MTANTGNSALLLGVHYVKLLYREDAVCLTLSKV